MSNEIKQENQTNLAIGFISCLGVLISIGTGTFGYLYGQQKGGAKERPKVYEEIRKELADPGSNQIIMKNNTNVPVFAVIGNGIEESYLQKLSAMCPTNKWIVVAGRAGK